MTDNLRAIAEKHFPVNSTIDWMPEARHRCYTALLDAERMKSCEHNVVCGNDAGGWWCGSCNKTLTRYYVNKYVKGRK